MGVHIDVPADAIFANTYINLDLARGSEEVRVKVCFVYFCRSMEKFNICRV